MAGDGEALVAESGHQLDELGGHLPLGIALAPWAAGRGIGLAVAAEVGCDDAVGAGEVRGDPLPAEMGLGEAVEEEQRRAGASLGDEVGRLPYDVTLVLESRQGHGRMIGLA
jgi:hypothetical protein